MHVAWFHPQGAETNYDNLMASVWIRCLQLIPFLEGQGIRCSVNLLDAVSDIAVFVRWQDQDAFRVASRLKSAGVRIVFDLCVNYFDETEVAYVGRPVTSRHREEVLHMLSVADAVTCASAFIAERARDFHPCVCYIPDSINRAHFKRSKSLDDFQRPRLRAVWSGIAIKSRELEPVLPFIKRNGLDLTIISNKPQPLKVPGGLWARNYPYRYLHWSYEKFPQDILEGDLCIAPRQVNNPYNRGHSLFKIGVFMAQGVPVLASPVPSYTEVLKGDLAGCVCDSLADWELKLNLLCQDRALLTRWSGLSQSSIEPYLTEKVVGAYTGLFQALC